MSCRARNTLRLLEIGRECIARKVHLHVAKGGTVFDNTMQSKIVAVVLGLVAEIERDFISSRTKEALAKRKAEGINKVAIANPAQFVVNPDEIFSCFIAHNLRARGALALASFSPTVTLSIHTSPISTLRCWTGPVGGRFALQ